MHLAADVTISTWSATKNPHVHITIFFSSFWDLFTKLQQKRAVHLPSAVPQLTAIVRFQLQGRRQARDGEGHRGPEELRRGTALG